MIRIFLSIGLFSALGLAACTNQPDYRAATEDPETVASIDLDQYDGLWYEIARYPNGFQKNCEGVTAEYTQRDDGKVTVLNTCHSGKARTAEGVAWIVEGSGGAKLKVQFAPEWVPFASGDYWVLDLADDYTSALVGSPSGEYLWILSRTPVISDELYGAITARAEQLGYETAPLKKTDQTGS